MGSVLSGQRAPEVSTLTQTANTDGRVRNGPFVLIFSFQFFFLEIFLLLWSLGNPRMSSQ